MPSSIEEKLPTQQQSVSAKSSAMAELYNAAQIGMASVQALKQIPVAIEGFQGKASQPGIGLDVGKTLDHTASMLGSASHVFKDISSGSKPIGSALAFAGHAKSVVDSVSGVLGPIAAVGEAVSTLSTIKDTCDIEGKCSPEYLLKDLKNLDKQIAKEADAATAKPKLVEERANLVENATALARVAIAKQETKGQIDNFVKAFDEHRAFPGASPEQIKQTLMISPSAEEKAAVNTLKKNTDSELNHGVVNCISKGLKTVGSCLIAASPLCPPLAAAGALTTICGIGAGVANNNLTKQPKDIKKLAKEKLITPKADLDKRNDKAPIESKPAEKQATANNAPSWCKPAEGIDNAVVAKKTM